MMGLVGLLSSTVVAGVGGLGVGEGGGGGTKPGLPGGNALPDMTVEPKVGSSRA